MKRAVVIGISALAVIAAAGQAIAADMYVPAPTGGYKDAPYVPETWTGFYAGINGGYGWSAKSSNVTATGNNQVVVWDGEFSSLQPVTQSGAKSFDADGGFGGGQIGYNLQALRVFWWKQKGSNQSSGSPRVRILRARYSSSRRPKARRWMTRILLLKPSTKPRATLFSGLQ